MIRRLNLYSFYLSGEASVRRLKPARFRPTSATHAVFENEVPSLPVAVSSGGGDGAGERERRRRRDFDFARRGQGDGQEDLARAQSEIASVVGL
jgi:hypothetical protein